MVGNTRIALCVVIGLLLLFLGGCSWVSAIPKLIYPSNSGVQTTANGNQVGLNNRKKTEVTNKKQKINGDNARINNGTQHRLDFVAESANVIINNMSKTEKWALAMWIASPPLLVFLCLVLALMYMKARNSMLSPKQLKKRQIKEKAFIEYLENMRS